MSPQNNLGVSDPVGSRPSRLPEPMSLRHIRDTNTRMHRSYSYNGTHSFVPNSGHPANAYIDIVSDSPLSLLKRENAALHQDLQQKEQECILAATAGQNLLNQIEQMAARIQHLESLQSAASRNMESSPKKNELKAIRTDIHTITTSVKDLVGKLSQANSPEIKRRSNASYQLRSASPTGSRFEEPYVAKPLFNSLDSDDSDDSSEDNAKYLESGFKAMRSSLAKAANEPPRIAADSPPESPVDEQTALSTSQGLGTGSPQVLITPRRNRIQKDLWLELESTDKLSTLDLNLLECARSFKQQYIEARQLLDESMDKIELLQMDLASLEEQCMRDREALRRSDENFYNLEMQKQQAEEQIKELEKDRAKRTTQVSQLDKLNAQLNIQLEEQKAKEDALIKIQIHLKNQLSVETTRAANTIGLLRRRIDQLQKYEDQALKDGQILSPLRSASSRFELMQGRSSPFVSGGDSAGSAPQGLYRGEASLLVIDNLNAALAYARAGIREYETSQQTLTLEQQKLRQQLVDAMSTIEKLLDSAESDSAISSRDQVEDRAATTPTTTPTSTSERRLLWKEDGRPKHPLKVPNQGRSLSISSASRLDIISESDDPTLSSAPYRIPPAPTVSDEIAVFDISAAGLRASEPRSPEPKPARCHCEQIIDLEGEGRVRRIVEHLESCPNNPIAGSALAQKRPSSIATFASNPRSLSMHRKSNYSVSFRSDVSTLSRQSLQPDYDFDPNLPSLGDELSKFGNAFSSLDGLDEHDGPDLPRPLEGLPSESTILNPDSDLLRTSVSEHSLHPSLLDCAITRSDDCTNPSLTDSPQHPATIRSIQAFDEFLIDEKDGASAATDQHSAASVVVVSGPHEAATHLPEPSAEVFDDWLAQSTNSDSALVPVPVPVLVPVPAPRPPSVAVRLSNVLDEDTLEAWMKDTKPEVAKGDLSIDTFGLSRSRPKCVEQETQTEPWEQPTTAVIVRESTPPPQPSQIEPAFSTTEVYYEAYVMQTTTTTQTTTTKTSRTPVKKSTPTVNVPVERYPQPLSSAVPSQQSDTSKSVHSKTSHEVSLPGDVAAADDSFILESLTYTLIGSWFQKYNRHGKNPKLRYFWVNPFSRTLNWAVKPPSQGTQRLGAKTACIVSVSTPSDIHLTLDGPQRRNFPPNINHAIRIETPYRDILLVPTNWFDYQQWVQGLRFLVENRHDIIPLQEQIQFMPTRSTTGSAAFRASIQRLEETGPLVSLASAPTAREMNTIYEDRHTSGSSGPTDADRPLNLEDLCHPPLNAAPVPGTTRSRRGNSISQNKNPMVGADEGAAAAGFVGMKQSFVRRAKSLAFLKMGKSQNAERNSSAGGNGSHTTLSGMPRSESPMNVSSSDHDEVLVSQRPSSALGYTGRRSDWVISEEDPPRFERGSSSTRLSNSTSSRMSDLWNGVSTRFSASGQKK
ncbi:uncharacterized protein BJ171DRAFT_172266 [Polychytrium aggregatum]|uniref:uncharacterized protein n=1 Tax=Polychytrium aggregatum TaxID=110093 RepID=UPI0022FEDBF0|nr:uncharacterized protein BJ171DRAFT_172266 [Polychytrium aggregatum]KAI9208968.1 hypothetical protein BJ171DRAFT_172266 [Polychytrium aggregatum]